MRSIMETWKKHKTFSVVIELVAEVLFNDDSVGNILDNTATVMAKW